MTAMDTCAAAVRRTFFRHAHAESIGSTFGSGINGVSRKARHTAKETSQLKSQPPLSSFSSPAPPRDEDGIKNFFFCLPLRLCVSAGKGVFDLILLRADKVQLPAFGPLICDR